MKDLRPRFTNLQITLRRALDNNPTKQSKIENIWNAYNKGMGNLRKKADLEIQSFLEARGGQFQGLELTENGILGWDNLSNEDAMNLYFELNKL